MIMELILCVCHLQMICGIVRSLHSKYGECIVSDTEWQIIEQTMNILKGKDICIILLLMDMGSIHAHDHNYVFRAINRMSSKY